MHQHLDGQASAGRARGRRGHWSHVTGVSIDTRTIAPGELFVALAGESRDGHAFVADALDRGAGAAMVSHVPDGVAAVSASRAPSGEKRDA